MYHKLPLLL